MKTSSLLVKLALTAILIGLLVSMTLGVLGASEDVGFGTLFVFLGGAVVLFIFGGIARVWGR